MQKLFFRASFRIFVELFPSLFLIIIANFRTMAVANINASVIAAPREFETIFIKAEEYDEVSVKEEPCDVLGNFRTGENEVS